MCHQLGLENYPFFEKNYPKIELWEKNQGIIPTENDFTEENFEEQQQLLKKNFSHERVEWLEKAGKILYGKSVVETTPNQTELRGINNTGKKRQYQQTANTRQSAAQKNQKKWPILLIAGTAVMLLIVMLLSTFQE